MSGEHSPGLGSNGEQLLSGEQSSGPHNSGASARGIEPVFETACCEMTLSHGAE